MMNYYHIREEDHRVQGVKGSQRGDPVIRGWGKLLGMPFQ